MGPRSPCWTQILCSENASPFAVRAKSICTFLDESSSQNTTCSTSRICCVASTMHCTIVFHGQQSATFGWLRGRYRYLLLLWNSQRRPRSRSGRTEDCLTAWRTEEKLFVWSFVCRLPGWFSSLVEVIIGLGLHIQCSKLTCFAKEKVTWFLGGENDNRCRLLSRVLAGRRASWKRGKQVEDGVSKLKRRRKYHHGHRSSNPDECESESQSFTCGMLNALTSACSTSGLTLDRSCSVVLPRHLLDCLKAFLLGWRTVLLSRSWSAWQVSKDSTSKTTSEKNMFGGVRRRSPHACVWQGRCPKDTNCDAPCGGFESFPSLELLWKQCTLNYYLKS